MLAWRHQAFCTQAEGWKPKKQKDQSQFRWQCNNWQESGGGRVLDLPGFVIGKEAIGNTHRGIGRGRPPRGHRCRRGARGCPSRGPGGGPPAPPWVTSAAAGPGPSGVGPGESHMTKQSPKRLDKAPTDYTKTQKRLCKDLKILHRDVQYQTRVATNINNRWGTLFSI